MHIEDIVALPHRSIRIVDIGAAFFGEAPPYQPLLDRELGVLTAFEPHAPSREALQEHLGQHAQVLPYAVGDGGTHTLHICQAPGMNSLLEPDEQALAFFNLFSEFGRVTGKTEIATVRLDDCSEVGTIDYLKMDVQGSELSILRGGRTSLANCLVLQTEMSFIPLYRSQPVFADIDVELRTRGMVPHCFAHLDLRAISPTVRENNPRLGFNQLMECDMVYMRDLIHRRPPVGDLKKIAVIAHHCYKSFDLAAKCILALQEADAVPRTSCQTYYESVATPA